MTPMHNGLTADTTATVLLLLGAGTIIALYALGMLGWELFVIATFLLLLAGIAADRLLDRDTRSNGGRAEYTTEKR